MSELQLDCESSHMDDQYPPEVVIDACKDLDAKLAARLASSKMKKQKLALDFSTEHECAVKKQKLAAYVRDDDLQWVTVLKDASSREKEFRCPECAVILDPEELFLGTCKKSSLRSARHLARRMLEHSGSQSETGSVDKSIQLANICPG